MRQNEPLNTATFADLLAATHRSAVHLEMRDVYAVGDEREDFENFLRTGMPNLDPARSFWPQWMPLVKDAVARGVVMRRARIVSEPVTDHIRYEHAITPLNLQVGEDVRRLSRRHASDIPLPGNDFWLLDGRIVPFHHFTGTGDGAPDGKERTDDLIATVRAVDSMYLEWRRLHRNGMRNVQQDWNAVHERTRVRRVHVSNVPPGFFQTPGFATALMEQLTRFQGTPNDVSEAVAARIARSRFLYEGGHRYVVLMEESVLRYRTVDPTP